MPDFRLTDHGTVSLLRPVTEEADDWAERHLPADAAWFGGAVAIEHRYVDPILAGIRCDGLTVGA